VSTPPDNQVNGQTSKSYDNPLLGFKFQYPTEFGEPSQGNGGVSFIFDKPNDGNFAFDKLSVFIVDLNDNMTLKQYIREYTKVKAGVDYATLKINETKLSGLPAITATYDISPSMSKVFEKVQTTFAIKDNTVYQIYYGTAPEIFDERLAQVNNVIKSFQITG
jgi:hypothetical protein